MAESKNNRKKAKKRAKNHSAPVDAAAQAQREQEAERARKEESRHFIRSFAAIAFMFIGIFVARSVSGLVGYSISFIAGLWGIYETRFQQRGRKISLVCYIIYCALTAYMLVATILTMVG